MEFYTIFSFPFDKLYRFNSQWDGILPNFSGYTWTEDFSFNSQWDGILLLVSSNLLNPTSWFQFPMGWNSTLLYLARQKFQKCFNSQWDGILRTSLYKYENEYECFNSQWDGILLKLSKPELICNLFQFPMGWNSTSKKIRSDSKR